MLQTARIFRLLTLASLQFGIFFQSAEAQQVQITGFSDIALGSWTGSGDLSSEDGLCVYNSATANYRIRASGSGAGNAFSLSGVGDDVDYEVRFREDPGSYVSLTAHTFQNYTGANQVSPSCSGVDNARLEVRVTAAELSTVPSGNYSGTLTVLLETR